MSGPSAWTEGALTLVFSRLPYSGKKLSGEEHRAIQDTQDSIVCHTPLNNLGFSRKGSARTFCVTFQALRAGLYEVGRGAVQGDRLA